MPWVRFVDDFDWRATGKGLVAFKRGMTVFVTRRAAVDAIAAGKAVGATKPEESANAGR